ncbi:MAG TPA: GrpB family protein, partial [Thermomicrobiales bacterium]|nr:GrpB family protein [Thermomicrobiales bacterium]
MADSPKVSFARVRPSETSTEEEIRAATVGEPTAVNGPITLVSYDPSWPAFFAREDARIRSALAESDVIVELEHIGSTSVPGLSAKPIIDIQMIVINSSREETYVPQLVAAGYVLRIREPEWEEHRVLKGTDPDVNLHVFSPGSTAARRHLRFRDHLRTHDADRDLYERTKRELAVQNWTYVQNYADAKNEVIDEILARAARSVTPYFARRTQLNSTSSWVWRTLQDPPALPSGPSSISY